MAHTHTPLSTNLDLLLSLASCGPDLNISVCYNVDRLFTAGQEHWEDPISETCLFGIKKPSRGVRDAFSHPVRQAGAEGWSWSGVREKHCYLAGGWMLELEWCERELL